MYMLGYHLPLLHNVHGMLAVRLSVINVFLALPLPIVILLLLPLFKHLHRCLLL